MPARKHAERAVRKRGQSSESVSTSAKPDTPQALKDDMDSILDEIDGVLEENAQVFVDLYVQRGGQ